MVSKIKSITVSNNLPIPSFPGRSRPIENYEAAFNNANIGISAGLSYDVNNNFSILIDSEWGLGSIINRAQLTNPNDVNYNLNLVNLTTNCKF